MKYEERVQERSAAASSALGQGRLYMQVSLWPPGDSRAARGQEVREAVCASTYVGGLFLRQFQLLLGIFESLGVFVQFIFGALEFLL